MQPVRRCFVISPIGEKGSDIRKGADDLFDLVIEPSLERFGFEVIRADKLNTVASITAEIIELVQNADICIIDLTNHNPNVMYECGRRHETGKPYIMLARHGEKLPFDVNTIRTIFYDLSSSREIRSTVKVIHSIVERIMADGFQPGGSGESLASILDVLKRIERKIDDVTVSPAIRTASARVTNLPDVAALIRKLGDPIQAFNYALTQRDVLLAEALLPRIVGHTSHESYVRSGLAQVAELGSKIAVTEIEKEFTGIEGWSEEHAEAVISSYVQGVFKQDWEQRALEKLSAYFQALRKKVPGAGSISLKHKTFMLNQLARLLYGARKFDESKDIAREVVSADPNRPAHHTNLAFTLVKSGDPAERQEAIRHIDAAFILADTERYRSDEELLDSLVRLYCEVENGPRVREVFSRLSKLNPEKATVRAEDGSIQQYLAGN